MKHYLLLPMLVANLGMALVSRVIAQPFTTLHSFGILTNITGSPVSKLVQAPDGTLYGTAGGEGSIGGTVFKMQPDGSGFTVLKWITNSTERAQPYAGLALSSGVLYGTACYGGSRGYGTVFKLNTDGTGYTVLKDFTGGSDGNNPHAGLTLSGGVLYGTTVLVGGLGYGNVFKLNTDGTGYSVLKNFTGGSDGGGPNGELTLSGSVLYGTTASGGSWGFGTVFQLNTDGTGYAVLKNFGFSDAAYPTAGLTLSGNILYGTTLRGGSSDGGTAFKVNTDGTAAVRTKGRCSR